MRAIVVDKDYLGLVKTFPLRRIRSHNELDKAGAIFTALGLKNKRTNGEQDYYEVLGQLIYQYESEHLPFLQTLSPQEFLTSLMEDNDLSQSELARQIDCHQSHLSDFLAGRRGLSKNTIAKLANRFKVSPSVFLPTFNHLA